MIVMFLLQVPGVTVKEEKVIKDENHKTILKLMWDKIEELEHKESHPSTIRANDFDSGRLDT